MNEGTRSAFCPQFHRAVELIGRRWTGAILRAMLAGSTRFHELAETVPGMSDRMLAERLRELEDEGVIVRTVIPETPVRIDYTLTAKGRELDAVVGAISGWAEKWVPPDERGSPAGDGPQEIEVGGGEAS